MMNESPAMETKEEYKKEVLKNLEYKQEVIKYNKKQVALKWEMNNTIIGLFKDNIKRDQKLRLIYAIILIAILVFDLFALVTIFVLAGCGVLNYSDVTFNLFITGGIAEVFVLVKVIVEYLFKDNLTNALNIILENNNKWQYNKKNYKNKK